MGRLLDFGHAAESPGAGFGSERARGGGEAEGVCASRDCASSEPRDCASSESRDCGFGVPADGFGCCRTRQGYTGGKLCRGRTAAGAGRGAIRGLAGQAVCSCHGRVDAGDHRSLLRHVHAVFRLARLAGLQESELAGWAFRGVRGAGGAVCVVRGDLVLEGAAEAAGAVGFRSGRQAEVSVLHPDTRPRRAAKPPAK